MKRSVFPLLILILAACNGATSAVTNDERPTSNVDTPTQPATLTIPIATFTPTSSLTPTISSTETPTTIPCDALTGYCLSQGHFVLSRPIARPGTVTIDGGYPYGSTEGGTREPHHGVEFYNASGTPVLAAADGIVAVAGTDSQQVYAVYPNTYGNLIVLEHHLPGFDQIIYTLYGHLSKVEVQVGQTVQAGEAIGLVGASGEAIGSHLHFEVREGEDNYDSNRNPVLWLKPLDTQNGTDGMLAGRLEDRQGKSIHTNGINIQFFPDRNEPKAAAWQVETYAPEKHPVQEDDTLHENFSLGDLTPGDYRISLMWGGKLYERWVIVANDQLTYFVLQVQ